MAKKNKPGTNQTAGTNYGFEAPSQFRGIKCITGCYELDGTLPFLKSATMRAKLNQHIDSHIEYDVRHLNK